MTQSGPHRDTAIRRCGTGIAPAQPPNLQRLCLRLVVLQVLSVVVPLLVAALSTLRWPTLQRRVKGHLELLKEVPAEAGRDFRDAVEEEMQALAEQIRGRLDGRWRIAAGGVLDLIVTAALLGLAAFNAGLFRDTSAVTPWHMWLSVMWRCAVLLFAYTLLGPIFRALWRGQQKSRTQRLQHRLIEQRNRIEPADAR
ncbi:MAG: hypothetical protein JWO67_6931 [Streptosporangiaceae bacterium]|nr:hypothetical protein [Streptosporangiaceae bacterium]